MCREGQAAGAEAGARGGGEGAAAAEAGKQQAQKRARAAEAKVEQERKRRRVAKTKVEQRRRRARWAEAKVEQERRRARWAEAKCGIRLPGFRSLSRFRDLLCAAAPIREALPGPVTEPQDSFRCSRGSRQRTL